VITCVLLVFAALAVKNYTTYLNSNMKLKATASNMLLNLTSIDQHAAVVQNVDQLV